MRVSKVKIYYGRLSDDQLTTLAGKIAGSMDGNPRFPAPFVPIATFESLIEDHRRKTQMAVNGGSSMDQKLKRESRQKLLKSLRILAYYVNIEADGDLPALTSSGMLLEKTPSPIERPYRIDQVYLKDSNLSGQIRTDFDAQRNVDGYEIQLGERDRTSNEISWGDSVHTSRSINNVLAPVVPSQRYYVRVRARNKKGVGDWSEPVSIIAR